MSHRFLLVPAALILLSTGCDRSAAPGPAPAGTTPVTANPKPVAPPSTPASTAPPQRDPRAQAALDRIALMRKAYTDAPTMTDHVVVQQLWGGRESPEAIYDIKVGHGTDIEIKTNANTIVTLDDDFYFSHAMSEADRYYHAPLAENVVTTMRTNFRAYRGVMHHATLRYGLEMGEVLYSLTFGLPDESRVSNYRSGVEYEPGGKKYEEITLISGSGSTVLFIDPDTNFLMHAKVSYTPSNAPVRTFKIERICTFDPKVYDELPEPITFETEGRFATNRPTMLQLQNDPRDPLPLGFEIGEVAPDFELFTLEGMDVKLSEFRGLNVVLAMWSVTSVDAVRDLKQIQAYEDHVQRTGALVKVLPIHTMVRGYDNAEAWDKATAMLESQNMSITSLIDPDNVMSKEWGLRGLPAIIILDADGRLTQTRPMFGEDLYGWLLEETADAFPSGP